MRRALRWDGLLPNKFNDDGSHGEVTPDDVREMRAFVERERAGGMSGFDIVVEGETPGDDPMLAREKVGPFAEAGATWWLESRWSASGVEEVRERIGQGPPALRVEL